MKVNSQMKDIINFYEFNVSTIIIIMLLERLLHSY